MGRRIFKIILWGIGGVISLVLLAYTVLLLANREDRPPAAEIAILKSIQEDASPVVSDNNSYLFMLGFAGPPDSDPMSIGIERYEWMKLAGPEFDGADDPLGDESGFRADRSDAVSQLAETCAESESECSRVLDSGKDVVNRWLADERWLLDRYRSLISMTEFSEATPFEMLAPLPPFDVLMEGQRLHMVDAWTSATEGDAMLVRAALDNDLTYWRMVLKNSDVLITKMIATAAIIRHFKLGNIILRRLPQRLKADGIPASWRTAISVEERSMKRCLAGEWIFFDETTKKIVAEPEVPFGSWLGVTDYTIWDRLAWSLLEPLWQPQDLSNRHARLMLDLGNAFDVPYEEIPHAMGLADDLQDSAYRRFGRLYNFTGDLVMSANFWSLSDYAVRVSDLEGIRRAALLVAYLRASETNKDDLVNRIVDSELVDPYTNKPFVWIASEGVVVFSGLQSHEERSQHKLIF